MNKSELIAAVVEKTGIVKSEIEVIFSAIFETMIEALVKQEKIAIPGFGNFVTKVRKERKGRNPSTGKDIIIPKTVVAHFKAATPLKEILKDGQNE